MKLDLTRFRAIRYALPFVGGLIGFAIAGGLGLGLGMGVVLAAPTIWWLFRTRRELRAEHREAKAVYDERAATTYRPPIASRIMVWAILWLALLFVVYIAAIGFGHDSRAGVEWMTTARPAAEWLSTIVPALRRIPLDMIAGDQAEWAPSVQHVLFVGWFFLLLVGLWTAVDVLVINRRSWARVRSLYRRRGWGVMVLSCAAVIVAAVPILFFGLTPERNGFAEEAGLLMLAACFLAIALTFFVLILSCNALVAWSRTSSDVSAGEQTVTAPPLPSNMMRRALAWHIFGRMLGEKSDRH